MVVTTGNPANPTVVATLYDKGAKFTCSYDEEQHAMELAVKWMEDNLSATDKVVVFTDSKSICTALTSTSPGLDMLRSRMANLQPSLTIQWIPGHCDIPGNELADSATKSAATGVDTGRGITYGGICSQIRAAFGDPPIEYVRTTEVYSALDPKKEHRITSRRDQTLLAKLRSGKYIGLRSYRG